MPKEFTKTDLKNLKKRMKVTLKQLASITGFKHLQNIMCGEKPLSRPMQHAMKTLEFIVINGQLENYKKFIGVDNEQV